jgi:hypothetical protein
VAQDHFIIRFQTNEGRDVKINLSPPPKSIKDPRRVKN